MRKANTGWCSSTALGSTEQAFLHTFIRRQTMGNRAVITFDTTPSAPCIYLHWNGGRASIEAFLHAAKLLQITAPDDLPLGEAKTWAMDRLAELLAKRFFLCDVGTTVYRTTYGNADTDNHDNGVFVVDIYWDIVRRLFQQYPDELDALKTAEICDTIVSAERQAQEAA
jgi:hypothetical protein